MNPDIHYFSHCWWPHQAHRRRLTLLLNQSNTIERLVKTKKGKACTLYWGCIQLKSRGGWAEKNGNGGHNRNTARPTDHMTYTQALCEMYNV